MKPAEFLAKVRAGQRARARSATAAAPPASAPAAEPEVAAPEPSQYVTREELGLLLGLVLEGIRQHDRDQTVRSDSVLKRAAARPDEFDLDATRLMVIKAALAGGRRASSNLMDSKIRHATDAPNWAQQQTAHLYYLSHGCYPPE
jgi:hypothetical protein